MSLTIRNTKELLSSSNLKLKILLYSISGLGKTTFCSTAPNPIIAACETGNGRGLQILADSGIDFVEPENYTELEQFCSGHVGKDKDTLIVDGFSYATDGIIKDYALTVPRTQGNSLKRQMGSPEMDDYGTMAELERRLLAKLLSQDKHIIVTTLQDFYQPATAGKDPKPERVGGPDLPGMMRLGSAAMFDIVLKLDVRPVLLDPNNAKSRTIQRFFVTEGDGRYLAKSRFKSSKTNLFPPEVIFDLDKNIGTFDWFLSKALEGYKTTGAAG